MYEGTYQMYEGTYQMYQSYTKAKESLRAYCSNIYTVVTGDEDDSEEGNDNKPEKDLDDKKILESPPPVSTTKVQIVGATSDENQVRNICSDFLKVFSIGAICSAHSFTKERTQNKCFKS